MRTHKLLTAASLAAQLLLLPLLLNRTQLTALPWSMWALIAMALALAWTQATRDLRGLWPALVLALLGCVGAWRLLPLALAQIGLAALLASQNLQRPLQLSGWQIEVAFVQLLLLARLNTVLTLSAVLAVVFVATPPLLAQWSQPLWVSIGLQVLVAGLAVWQQSFTLITAAIAVLCGCALALRAKQLPPVATAWAGIVISVADIWTHLHG
ncbi:hypothetical protein [Lacticaseibacillus daqingensis]|uniref:hypothetical protein n=1 Tax=Lacticaseibacillus daqingensis TaxID=2486014 RepID=UPI000F76B160|nr:hypothetical protein [Lacticaseibacillus daqingensis]